MIPGPMTRNDRLSEQSQWLYFLFAHLAGSRVRAHVEIEDLVQEVFLRALAAPSGLPGEELGETALRRFLARIARNCVFDVLRTLRAKKRQGIEVRITHSDWSVSGVNRDQLTSDTIGPATRAVRSEEHSHLMAAFEKLSGVHRRVIGLRQFEGLSAAETGRRMGCSAVAVHSLYRRALKEWSELAGRENFKKN